MNIDRFSPLLQRTTLLLSLAAGSLLLTACGGGSDNKSSASSSSLLSSSARSSFSAASVPANGSGIWPSVKVEAQNPKVLSFQWTAVEGATHYKLYKQDGANGAVLLNDNIAGTSASDEIGVHVHDWVNTRYWVEACNTNGCANKSDLTFTATEMLKAIGYLKASNTGFADLFGWSIALSADGLTMAVGAPAEDSKATGVNGEQDNEESTNAGAVYVFVKENNLWVQQAYLKASNTEQPTLNSKQRTLPNDRFGYRVALADDGNTLAVSALLEDSPSFGINCNQDNYEITDYGSSDASSSVNTEDDLIKAQNYDVGAVYLFSRNAGSWTQDAYIKPLFGSMHAFYTTAAGPQPVALRFGETLAISGDGKTLAVGTTRDFLGKSGIFNLNSSSSVANSSFSPCFEFYPSSSSSTSSTSSSSSTTSSSSSSAGSSYDGGSGSGAVYLFRLEEDGWDEEAHLKASNAEQNDAFGASIALTTDGSMLVVGAIGEDSNATGINGDQANNACYYYDGTSYQIEAVCKEAYKYAVWGNITNGAAYVFSRSGSDWTQQAYLKPSYTHIATLFGYSVDIDDDGNTLAVGAIGDSSNATGINGSTTQSLDYRNTGATFVFTRSEATWSQEAYIKPSTLTVLRNDEGVVTGGGEFGGDVSLSKDGNTLAVGAFRESSNAKGINGDEGDTSMLSAGAVYVFNRHNTVWSQTSYVKASNTDAGDRFGLNLDLSGDGKTLAVGAHREAGRGYASLPASSASSETSSSSSSTSSGLDQNDNNLDTSGAVYIY